MKVGYKSICVLHRHIVDIGHSIDRNMGIVLEKFMFQKKYFFTNNSLDNQNNIL